MKNIIIYFILLFVSVSRFASAQITFEHAYTGAAEVADVENFGYKYYVTDYLTNSITIYNEDHSLWKTVMLNVPQNQSLYDVAYLSSKVFNSDDLVELLAVSYQYISTSDTSGYYIYLTQVLNENGSILLSVPGGAYSFTYIDENTDQKLVVYLYDFSVSSYISSTQVYGLPAKYTAINDNLPNQYLPYPNPSKNEINIPFKSTGSEAVQELILTDTKGLEYKILNINESEGSIHLNTSSLPSGSYIYFLRTNGRSLPVGKFVISR